MGSEYSLFYGALLQKRPIILRSLLIVATPYVVMGSWEYAYVLSLITHLYIHLYMVV